MREAAVAERYATSGRMTTGRASDLAGVTKGPEIESLLRDHGVVPLVGPMSAEAAGRIRTENRALYAADESIDDVRVDRGESDDDASSGGSSDDEKPNGEESSDDPSDDDQPDDAESSNDQSDDTGSSNDPSDDEESNDAGSSDEPTGPFEKVGRDASVLTRGAAAADAGLGDEAGVVRVALRWFYREHPGLRTAAREAAPSLDD